MRAERVLWQKEILRRSVFGIDIDGVVVDTAAAVIGKVNSELGTDFHPDRMDGWNWVGKTVYGFLISRGKSEQEARDTSDYCESLWYNPDVLRGAGVMPGAEDFIRKLDRLEVKYLFITSRPPGKGNKIYKATYEYFEEKFPWIPRSRILANPDASVLGDEYKWRMVAKEGVGRHIDDSPHQTELILRNTFASVYLLPFPASPVGFDHPRLINLRTEGRKATLRDMYKYLFFREIPPMSHNLDRIHPAI